MTTLTVPTPVRHAHVPTPRDLAVSLARRRGEVRPPAHVDVVAVDTVREAIALVSRLRAAGFPPVLAARITAGYLEAAAALTPDLQGWQP